MKENEKIKDNAHEDDIAEGEKLDIEKIKKSSKSISRVLS